MAESVKEKQICQNCDADIRPDTQFCYNCGTSVQAVDEPADVAIDDNSIGETIDDAESEKDKSLADLERALSAEFPVKEDGRSKLDNATSERKRARKGKSKPLEVVWEPVSADSSRVYLLFVILIAVITGAVLLIMVVTH